MDDGDAACESSAVPHWHKDLAPSTRDLVEAAPLTATKKGLRVAFELIAYPEGQVSVAVSTIGGHARSRTITQASSLMLNDIDEAKDAIDAIADRASREAADLS
jgi:hypothetical protein